MKILTANELLSGATVYLDRAGKWGANLQAARLFLPEEQDALAAAIAASAATGRLVSIETEKVRLDDARVVPDRIRERIRAGGPTAPVFTPQTLEEGDHVSI